MNEERTETSKGTRVSVIVMNELKNEWMGDGMNE